MTQSRFGGMTMNERLLEAGLIEAFDAALRARERSASIDIYRRVDAGDSAEQSVDSILADPVRYSPD
jgi:hypothetical protein